MGKVNLHVFLEGSKYGSAGRIYFRPMKAVTSERKGHNPAVARRKFNQQRNGVCCSQSIGKMHSLLPMP